VTAAALWGRAGPWVVVSTVWAAAIIAMAAAALLEPEDFRPAVAEVCDDAVHALLTTKDLVELERSKFLIEKLRCRVRTRL
jgi:anti-sigma-K factor RskA